MPDESPLLGATTEESGRAGAVDFGKDLHECGPESGIDPGIDEGVVGSVSHGEPVTPKVDVNENVGWVLDGSRVDP